MIQNNQPMFNVPNSVLIVIAAMFAVHFGWMVVPTEYGYRLLAAMAFIPARYSGMAEFLPGGTVASFSSPLTYQLVHGDLIHIAFNSLWLLAFGGAIALRVGSARFVAFAAVCGVIAAFAFLVFNWGAQVPVVGASGAVAGLMGGTMRFLFTAIDMGGIWRLRETPRAVPLMPIGVAVRDKRVIAASAIIIAINLLTAVGVGFGGGMEASTIAWESHIGGYLAGLLLFGLFDASRPRKADGPDLRVVH